MTDRVFGTPNGLLAAARECGLPRASFRQVAGSRSLGVLDNIFLAFTRSGLSHRHSLWMWEDFRDPVYSLHREHSLDTLLLVAPADTPVWFVVQHPDALAFAQLQACTIVALLEDPALADDVSALRAAIGARLAPLPRSIATALDEITALLECGATALDAATALGTSTLAIESVPVALWSFLAHHASFSEAVSAAAQLGGDVDSICSLVGALAGAQVGATAIDAQWIANLRHERPSPNALLELADSLVLLRPLPPPEIA